MANSLISKIKFFANQNDLTPEEIREKKRAITNLVLDRLEQEYIAKVNKIKSSKPYVEFEKSLENTPEYEFLLNLEQERDELIAKVLDYKNELKTLWKDNPSLRSIITYDVNENDSFWVEALEKALSVKDYVIDQRNEKFPLDRFDRYDTRSKIENWIEVLGIEKGEALVEKIIEKVKEG